MNQPTSCAWCGGELPPRAKSLCSPECRMDKQRQQARDNRRAARANGADKTIVKTCAQCGQEFKADRHSVLLCSRACRNIMNIESGQLRKACKVANANRIAAAKPKPTTCLVGRSICRECGELFLHDARTVRVLCGSECARVARNRRLDERKRPYKRHRKFIFNRDRFICQLCGTPTANEWTADDPLSPVLDHIQPRSKGGSDDPSNLQTAHWICNSLKGDNETITRLPAPSLAA